MANNLGGFFDRKQPNRLFRNNGDGTFTDVTREAGLRTRWATIGAAWGDFSNNGRPDLFLSGLGRAQLFRNQGDGTFRDVSREAGVDRPAIGSVAAAWDIDDDGWLDIVQFTYSRPEDAIHTLRHGHGPDDGGPLRVFRNNRDGTFTEVAARLGITGCWGTMTANLGDFDNDGYPDMLLGNGDPAMDRCEAPVLLANYGPNDSDRRFRNVAFTAGLPFTGKGHGANLADLAGDGRLHLLMANGGLYPGDLLTTTVHRPRELPGNYLNVRLVGTTGNRDAIGARLALDGRRPPPASAGLRRQRLRLPAPGAALRARRARSGRSARDPLAGRRRRAPRGAADQRDGALRRGRARLAAGLSRVATRKPQAAAGNPSPSRISRS